MDIVANLQHYSTTVSSLPTFLWIGKINIGKADLLRFNKEKRIAVVIKGFCGHNARSVRQIGYSGFLLTKEEKMLSFGTWEVKADAMIIRNEYTFFAHIH